MLRGEAQAFVEVDARLPPEQLSCARDVGPGVADVSGPLGELFASDRLPEDAPDLLRELVHRRRPAGRDVEHAAVDGVGGRRAQVRVDDVRDVREVPPLLAVAVNGNLPSLGDTGDEAR